MEEDEARTRPRASPRCNEHAGTPKQNKKETVVMMVIPLVGGFDHRTTGTFLVENPWVGVFVSLIEAGLQVVLFF